MTTQPTKHAIWVTLTACLCGCPEAEDPTPYRRAEVTPDASSTDSGEADAGTMDAATSPGDAGDADDVVPTELAQWAPESLVTNALCVPLDDGERLGGVSPEGHAWLLLEGDEGVRIRVWDPEVDAETPASEAVLDMPRIDVMRAWSATRADMLAGGGLWTLEDMRRGRIDAPMTLDPDATFCGALGEDALILTGGTFHTQRDRRWWSWDPAAQTQAPSPDTLLGRDGECYGPDASMWATAGGTVWELATPAASATETFDAIERAAALDEGIAVVEGGLLWWGTPDAFEAWRFETGSPELLASSGGHAWFMVGDELIRFDGDTFERVAHGSDSTIESIHPFHNGAWAVDGASACQHRLGATLRVDGARPNQRFAEPTVRFDVTLFEGSDAADDTPSTFTATLDGEPLTTSEPDASGTREVAAELAPGWHTIELRAARGDLEATRTLHLAHTPPAEEPASWGEDVEPIFTQHCSGSQCHGPTVPSLDLTTYESWRENAQNIRNRVIVTESMPPMGARDSWTVAEQNTIERWLDTGMAP